MIISFTTRAGDKITGQVLDEVGINYLIRVTAANRKLFRGRTTLFPKHDMAHVTVDGRHAVILQENHHD